MKNKKSNKIYIEKETDSRPVGRSDHKSNEPQLLRNDQMGFGR